MHIIELPPNKKGEVKYKFFESYKDTRTDKWEKVSVTLPTNTNQSRKKAQTILAEKIVEKQKKIFNPDFNYTLANLTAAYENDQKNSVSLSTQRRNMFACRAIEKILGYDTLLTNLTAGFAREKFLKTGEPNSRLNERLARFKALIRWGYENDMVADIGFLDKLKRFKDRTARAKVQNKFLEAEGVRTLLDAMKHDTWQQLTRFMILSGVRVGEALALLGNDVDLSDRIIHVTKTYDSHHKITAAPKTEDSIREIYMTNDLYALCKEIKQYNAWKSSVMGISSTLFFNGSEGQQLEYAAFNQYLNRTAKKVLGRDDITTHVLRHTACSLLLEQGIPIDVVSGILGHSDSRITKEIYAHVTKKLKEKHNEMLRNVKVI